MKFFFSRHPSIGLFLLSVSCVFLPALPYGFSLAAPLPRSAPSPMLYHFPESNDNDRIFIATSDLTSQNKTYVLTDSQLRMKRAHTAPEYSIMLEMEILTPLAAEEFIVFGINKDAAISYNPSTDTYNGIFIDTRAYYLQKQYYRILVQIPDPYQPSPSNTDDNNSQDYQNPHQSPNPPSTYYVTIFLKSENATFRTLKHSLTLQIFDYENAKADSPCPFDCLNHGSCNRNLARCECHYGYVDLDCSKPSESLSALLSSSTQSQPHTNPNEESTLLEWITLFDPQQPQGNFYSLPLASSNEGFLYLSVQSQHPLASLEVFYTLETTKFSNLGIADRGYSKTSKTIHKSDLISETNATAVEIFIDRFVGWKNSPDHLLLFGLRSHPSAGNTVPAGENNQLSSSVVQYNLKLFWASESDHANKHPTGVIELLRKHVLYVIALIVLLTILILLILVMLRLRASAHRYSAEQQLILRTKKDKQNSVDEDATNILARIPTYDFTSLSKHPDWIKMIDDAKQQHDILQKQQTQSQNGENPPVAAPADDDSLTPACSICLCEFEEGDSIKVTHCPHFFHQDCLFSWLKKQKNCPHCRNPLTLDALPTNDRPPTQDQQQSTINEQSNSLQPPGGTAEKTPISSVLPQFLVFSPNRKKQKTPAIAAGGYMEQIDESTFHSTSISTTQGYHHEMQNNQLYQKFSLEFTPTAHRGALDTTSAFDQLTMATIPAHNISPFARGQANSQQTHQQSQLHPFNQSEKKAGTSATADEQDIQIEMHTVQYQDAANSTVSGRFTHFISDITPQLTSTKLFNSSYRE